MENTIKDSDVSKFKYRGVTCFVIKRHWELLGVEAGWGNGYVVLPKGHKYESKDYYDEGFNIEFSDEVTLADSTSRFNKIGMDLDDGWVFGFDTAHSWNREGHDKDWVISKTKELADALLK